MPSPKDDRAHLLDIVTYGREILAHTADQTFNSFLSDRKLQALVERDLEVMGEATSRLSEEFKMAHPEIPWRKIIALRNVITHEYGEIIYKRLWAVVTEHLPGLLEQLKPFGTGAFND
ncbi:MAG: DUF86 domain-containing protein [Elusimicrobia bacterium]|nr:DUF86 domain-containing protein [Elusimicrobiota bacterium]